VFFERRIKCYVVRVGKFVFDDLPVFPVEFESEPWWLRIPGSQSRWLMDNGVFVPNPSSNRRNPVNTVWLGRV
jgi:hypothetical protein